MPLTDGQARVLDAFVARLPADATWAMFGSVDAVLRGSDDHPNDVDVLATERTAALFREAFPDAHEDSRAVPLSQIDDYRLYGEEIEVIYDRDAIAGQRPLVDWEAVTTTQDPEHGVPMLPVEAVAEAYRAIDEEASAARLERLGAQG